MGENYQEFNLWLGSRKIIIMKRVIWILFFLMIIGSISHSQKLWTLEECIGYAFKNSIQLKRQLLQSESAKNNYNHSLIRILPGITAFANHDYNSGRALNYDLYQWENREFEQGNLGVETRLNVFNGMQSYNNIHQQRFLLLSKLEDVERTRNDISLNISAAYFQILLDKEMIEIAERKLEISSLELEAAKSNFQLGNIPRGRVLEIESQVASDEYQLTLNRNNLSRSYLDLLQMMQIDPGEDFKIARPEIIEIQESVILHSVDNIYTEAEIIMPQVKVAEYFLKSRESELSMIRGQQSPRLVLRGLFYSRYSELAVNPLDGANYPYRTQIKDNQYRQLGISLTFPIFDGWNVRNRISNAKISVLDANYQLDETRQNLYSEIHLMHNNAKSAYNRYKSSGKEVLAAKEAFEYAQEQFRLGLINFIDYQFAHTNLFRSQSNMVQAKYEYFIRSRILEFYLGEPLARD